MMSKNITTLNKQLDTVEDFVLDPEFRDWATSPNRTSNIFWEEWLSSNPKKAAIAKEAIQLINSMARIDYTSERSFEERIWNGVEHGISGKDEVREVVPLNQSTVLGKYSNKPPKRNYKWLYSGIAASFLVLVASSIFFLDKEIPVEPVVLQESEVLKENPKGQKSTIILPDGTKVILNSESKLRYTNSYNTNERKVYLDGEAFFDVTKDATRPFKVETKNLVTVALGTSFNIDAYSESHEEVVLLTGKVRIDGTNKALPSTILMPGEKMRLDEQGTLSKSIAADNVVAWKDGIIFFQDTPLALGILELERWYDVDIEVRNLPTNKKMSFTGKFDNDYLSNVLASLSYTMKFDYKIEDKKITINFK